MDERITALFRACDPSESLEPGDPRYVNVDDARGEAVAPKYANCIALADPNRPDKKLFAGHLGIGKTSELLRLKQLLGLSLALQFPPYKALLDYAAIRKFYRWHRVDKRYPIALKT